jgi:hypothetical protein
MNILFVSNQISERGTEIALYDYALGNENVLYGKSFIAANDDSIYDLAVLKKFQDKFEVCLYKSIQELVSFIKIKKIELIYQISYGKKEKLITEIVPSFIHCVFTTKEKFGAFYCPISNYLNKYYRTKYPVLPHMVRKFPGTTKNLRKDINIPDSAIIFGGYGGKDSFNIPFVRTTVCDIAKKHKNIYFIFLNFTKFAEEDFKNVILLPKNTDISYKEAFINTCDAMLHARLDGETFGLSVAEFSVKNKPIVTWNPSIIKNPFFILRSIVRFIRGQGHLYAKAHLEFLGKKAISYASSKDLWNIIIHFREKYLKDINYDCYSDRFSEEKVMNRFKEIISGHEKSTG